MRSPLDALAAYLEPRVKEMLGSVEDCLQAYFNARISFFAENPLFLGIFFDASFRPPAALASGIACRQKAFDE